MAYRLYAEGSAAWGVGGEDMHVRVQVGNEAQTVMTGLFNVIIHVTSLRYLTCLNKELQVST